MGREDIPTRIARLFEEVTGSPPEPPDARIVGRPPAGHLLARILSDLLQFRIYGHFHNELMYTDRICGVRMADQTERRRTACMFQSYWSMR